MADESSTFQELREQLKEATKKLAAQEKLIEEAQGYRQGEALRKAGFDPESKQGKALLKLHGDGEVTVEAIRETAESYGLSAEPAGDAPAALPQATTERMHAQSVIDEVRSQAAPATGVNRMPYDEFKQMAESNPKQAAAALSSGRVEVPSHIASHLEANRNNRNPLGR